MKVEGVQAGGPGTVAAPGSAVASRTPGVPVLRVDLAHRVGDRLLIHGWILGLATLVARAEVRYGREVHDLLSRAVRMPRPDVTRHFSADAAAIGDNHGFHLTVAVADSDSLESSLRVAVALHSGETAESNWTVGHGAAQFVAFFEQNPPTLKWLLAHLEPQDAEPLRNIVVPALPPAVATRPSQAAMPSQAARPASVPPQLQFGFDLCCVLEHRLLLILGWCMDLDETSTAVAVHVGSSVLDFLAHRVFMPRPDIEAKVAPIQRREGGRQLGFIFLAAVPGGRVATDQVEFDFSTGAGRARAGCPIVSDAREARTGLGTLLGKLDADAAIELIERICTLLEDSPAERSLGEWLRVEHGRAVERLPISLESMSPLYFLHVDLAVPIGDEGIFLNGWFGAQPQAHDSIACHAGFTGVDVEGDWVRHPRPDVTSHLANKGMIASGGDHGFACYVRLKSGHAPYFIAVTSSDGRVRRMRIPTSAPTVAPLQTIRAVLTSFNIEHRALRALLDRQVGPAVQAAWAQRRKPRNPVAVQRFGAQPADPQISVIVPLYGRYDFAEYQLALFADDVEFQGLELLYFVDDPAIYDEFRLKCSDLQQIYQVPFTLVFAGSNLGFAGANNCAAAVARADHLVLLNSDVFPKYPGWAGAMLRVYRTLENPGLLGVKLLYEDGSVQHAGISFRRHPPWSDLWINYHPYKGQSPVGLRGVREADAVTAACVMVDRGLYHELGGLSEDYIVGDFEDSDLCLRAVAAGRRNRVALDIELFHLERQSQLLSGDHHWRTNLTVYNCWQHDMHWAGLIEQRNL